jgi:nicastrin
MPAFIKFFFCYTILTLLFSESTPNGGLQFLSTPLLSAQPCTRLNTLSTFSSSASGCSSSTIQGVSGYLRLVTTETSLINLLSELSSSTFSSSISSTLGYTLILPSSLLTLSILSNIRVKYQEINRAIAGVLVLPLINTSEIYSSGYPFPFNPTGRGLVTEKWPFPIFLITDPNEAITLVEKAKKNIASSPSTFPQWTATFKLYMGPDDLNSEDCLSSGSCLPLGGQSIWATPSTLSSSSSSSSTPTPLLSKKPVILACAPLDAIALFKGLSFGADASVSSLVTLLVAAQALSKEPSVPNLPFDIVFAAFQAESFGRLGSRRFLAKVTNITNRLAYAIAVDQVGLAYTNKGSGHFYSHRLFRNTSSDTTTSSDAIQLSNIRSDWAELIFSQLNVTPGSLPISENSVPSTPIVSVGEFAPTSGVLSFSEYNSTLISTVFQSEFDTFSNIDVHSVTLAAETLATGLYALATNKTTTSLALASVPTSLRVNTSLVADFINCITINAQCTLFSGLLGLDLSDLPSGPLTLYTSVFQQPYIDSNGNTVVTPSILEAVTRAALTIYTAMNVSGVNTTATSGSIPCSITSDCISLTGNNQAECLLGNCVIGNAYFHSAFSLSLEMDGNGGFLLFPNNSSNSNTYAGSGDPLYTEPYWSTSIGVTLYQADAPWLAPTLLSIGITITVATLGLSSRYLQTS